MRNSWAICKREFVSYFITPVGYVIVGAYAGIAGIGFVASFIFYCRVTKSPADYFYNSVPLLEEHLLSPLLVFYGQLIMFIGALVTMRLLAEERNRGTMELLLTHPLRDREIIFGKYLAALGIVMVLMGVVGTHMLIVAYFADVEPAVLGFGVVAVFLMGAAFVSLGLFVSALTRSQGTAASMTFGLWLGMWALGSYGEDMPTAYGAPENWPAWAGGAVEFLYGVFRAVVMEFPLDAHAGEMAKGVVRPEDVAYYLLFIAFFLFLTFQAFASRKWRA